MSLRNLKKLQGGVDLPPPDDSSEEEYEPLYVRKEKGLFANLKVSSESGSEEVEQSDKPEATDSDEKPKKVEVKKKSRNNKRGRRRAHANAESKKMDEIDKSVMEVNALLGKPPPAEPVVEEVVVKKNDILRVNSRYMNAAYEMKKLFGTDKDDDEPNARRRVPNLRRIHRHTIMNDPSAGGIQNLAGLSMIMLPRKANCAHFAFKHSKAYRENHINFLKITDHRFIGPKFMELGETFKHPEAQLQMADFAFIKEDYSLANSIVEKVISKMEAAFHPMFRVGDTNTRLEYKYIENRPFHVAMLKYVHALSNRACHRTALELAKMLMNLDPSDPLAVIFIIDVLAIRARQFDWLVEAIKHWKTERGADHMFNMMYSNALAHFHIACRSRGRMTTLYTDTDLYKANDLLIEAILSFPRVALHLMELANVSDAPRLANHDLFKMPPRTIEKTVKLTELYVVFANFAVGRWREREPLRWLIENVNHTLRLYETDTRVRDKASILHLRTTNVFRTVPIEIQRHLCVIKTMSELLVDGAIPNVPLTLFSDPLPVAKDTIDHPEYMKYSSNYKYQPNVRFNPDLRVMDDIVIPEYFGETLYSLINDIWIDSDSDSNYTGSDLDEE